MFEPPIAPDREHRSAPGDRSRLTVESECDRRLQALRARTARELTARAESVVGRQGSVGAASTGPGFGPGFALLSEGVDAICAAGVPVDPSTLVAMRSMIDRMTAAVCEAEVRLDVHEVWRETGASSLRGWLLDDVGLGRRAASASAKRSERLESWPDVLDAWSSGRLSGGQVDAMIAGVPRRFVALFSEHASGVIDAVADLGVDDTAAVVRRWVHCAESADGPGQLRERSSGVFLTSVLDDRAVLQGDLSRAEAAIVTAAIKDFDVPDPVDEHGEVIGLRRTAGQRAADALVAACRFAIDHREGASETGRFVPHVTLVVDAQEFRAAALRGAGVSTVEELESLAATRGWTVAERALFTDALAIARSGGGSCATTDGLELDAAAMGALCCDSVIQRVLMADGEILDMGRKVRTATAAQRRAIIARDRRCRAPGCRTGPKHCDVHHVDHWALGGATDVDRMVLLCGAHHREFHRPGHVMELSGDGVFTVRSPWGRSRSSRPGSVVEAEARAHAHDHLDPMFDVERTSGDDPSESSD